jgi:hypothetical protein
VNLPDFVRDDADKPRKLVAVEIRLHCSRDLRLAGASLSAAKARVARATGSKGNSAKISCFIMLSTDANDRS